MLENYKCVVVSRNQIIEKWDEEIKKHNYSGEWKIYKEKSLFVKNDLKSKGFKSLTLGVEPKEIRNIQIYFNWGLLNILKLIFVNMQMVKLQ